MARQQSAGELSRTIAGQWSKSEKRSTATREIMEANRRAHQIRKKFAQQLKMK
jgi:hypothetical protein